MPNIPIPIRAALGLAATAVEEARKLPETLPQAVTTVPVVAVSLAMRASMRMQQRIATLTAKGDQVLSEFRGTPSEPPAWATFDDEADDEADGEADSGGSEQPLAAFDRIDYDATGFVESDDDEDGRWDAVGAGSGVTGVALGIAEVLVQEEVAGALAENASLTDLPDDLSSVTEDGAPGESESTDLLPAPATAVVAAEPAPAKKATPAEKTAPAKKTAPAQVGPAEQEFPTAAPAKKAPAKKMAGRTSEPLEVAAKKARRATRPTPSTMAAEIVQAHEADSTDE